MISQFGSLWKIFIRPTRQEYNVSDLGQEISVYGQYRSKRTDLVIKNKKNLKLQCSFFEPTPINQGQNDGSNNKFNCVIYCHCNSGSRLEALRLLPSLISKGIGLFCFDFSGSGLSEGEYVTLGINESQDLECIVNYLIESGKILNIALWGRSMGAVTSMMFLNKKQSQRIKGVVFDSGFANLNFLALDFARQKTGMPNLVLDLAISQVSDQIKERVPIDIQSIDLTNFITNIYVPCFFVCSKEDTFVKCEHAEQLYARYNGQKWLEYVGGDHNAQRSNEVVDKISKWVDELVSTKDQQSVQQQQNNTQANQVKKGTATAVIDLSDNSQSSRKTSATQNKMINSASLNSVKQQVSQSPQNARGSINLERSVSPIKIQSDNISKPNMQQSQDINKVQYSQQQVMLNRSKNSSQLIKLQSQVDSQGQQQQITQQQQQQKQQKQMEYNQIIQQVKQEKERQLEKVSSQSRIPTEETSSRNENNEIINNNNTSGKNNPNQNGYSFLSNINEDNLQNDRGTPQKNTDGAFRDYEESPRLRAANNRRQDSQSFIQTQSSSSNLISTHQQVGGVNNDNQEIDYSNGDFPSRRNINQNFNSFQIPFNTSQEGDSPYLSNNSHKRSSVQNLAPISVNRLSSKNDFSKENSLAGTPQFKPDKKSIFGTSTITIDTSRNQVDSPVLRTDGKIEETTSYQGLNYQSPYGNPQKVRNPSQFSIQSMLQNQISSNSSNNNQNEGQNNQKVFDFNNPDLTSTPQKRVDKLDFVQGTEGVVQQSQSTQQPPKQQTLYQVTIQSQQNNSSKNLHQFQRNPHHHQTLDLVSSVPINQKDDQDKNNRNQSLTNNSSQRQNRSSTQNGSIPPENQNQHQQQSFQQTSAEQPSLKQNNEEKQNQQPNQVGQQQGQKQSGQQQNNNNQQNNQHQNQQIHQNPFYQSHQNYQHQNHQNHHNNHNHHSHQHHPPPPQRHTLATTREKTHGQSNNGIASQINEFLHNNAHSSSMKLKTVGNEPNTPKQIKQNHPQTTTSSYTQVNSNQNFLQLQQPFFSSYTGPISPSNPQQHQQKSGNPLIIQVQQGIQFDQINNPNSPARVNTQNIPQQYIRSRGVNGSIDATANPIGSELTSHNSGQNPLSSFNPGQKQVAEAKIQLSSEKQRAEQPQYNQYQQQGAPVKQILQGSYNTDAKNVPSNQYGLQQSVNMIINQQNTPSHLQQEKKTGFSHVPITSISISNPNNSINQTKPTEVLTNHQGSTSNIPINANNNIPNSLNMISNSQNTGINISNLPQNNQVNPQNTSNVSNNPLNLTNMNNSNNVAPYANSEATMSRKSTETSNYSSNAGDINFVKQYPIQNNSLQNQYGIDFTQNQGSSSGRKYSENVTQTNSNFNLYHNIPQKQNTALQYTQQANNKNLSITPPGQVEESSKGLAQQNIGLPIMQPSSTKNTTFSMPNKLFSTYDNSYSYKQDAFDNKKNSKNFVEYSESNQFAFSTQNQPALVNTQSATPKNGGGYRADLFKDSTTQYKQLQSQPQPQTYQKISNNK